MTVANTRLLLRHRQEALSDIAGCWVHIYLFPRRLRDLIGHRCSFQAVCSVKNIV